MKLITTHKLVLKFEYYLIVYFLFVYCHEEKSAKAQISNLLGLEIPFLAKILPLCGALFISSSINDDILAFERR